MADDQEQKDKIAQLPGAINLTMEDLDKLGLPKESMAAATPNTSPVQESLDPTLLYKQNLDKYRAMAANLEPLMTSNMGTAAEESPAQDNTQSQAAAPKSMPSAGMPGMSSDNTLQQKLIEAQKAQQQNDLAARISAAGERIGSGMAGGKLTQVTPDLTESKMLEAEGKNKYTQTLDAAKLQQANELKKAQMQMMAAQRQALLNQKQQMNDDNRVSQRVANLNRNMASDKQVQIAQATLGRVNNLKALVNSFENGKIPASQLTSELAGSIESVIRGGNSAVATLHEFLPKDAAGSVQKFKEWITSEPQGVDRSKYVNLMKHLVEREEGAANAVIKDATLRQLRGWKAEDANRPEIQDMMAARGILDKYNAVKSGEKVSEAPYTKELNESYSKASKEMSDHDKQAKEWANQNPNDPRSQQILDMLKSKGF